MTEEVSTTISMASPATLGRKFHSFNRKPRFEDGFDCPDIAEDPRNLYTLPYSELVESLADTLFPPNDVQDHHGAMRQVRASDSRIDRYVHFRAAWQPAFGERLQLALRDLTEASLHRHSGRHVRQITELERETLLMDLQGGRLPISEWTTLRSQQEAFVSIHDAITCGLMAEPGYGGNAEGLGWFYTRFMTIEA